MAPLGLCCAVTSVMRQQVAHNSNTSSMIIPGYIRSAPRVRGQCDSTVRGQDLRIIYGIGQVLSSRAYGPYAQRLILSPPPPPPTATKHKQTTPHSRTIYLCSLHFPKARNRNKHGRANPPKPHDQRHEQLVGRSPSENWPRSPECQTEPLPDRAAYQSCAASRTRRGSISRLRGRAS